MEYHDFKASSEQDYEYEVDNFQNNRDQAFMASIQPDDEYEVDNYLCRCAYVTKGHVVIFYLSKQNKLVWWLTK